MQRSNLAGSHQLLYLLSGILIVQWDHQTLAILQSNLQRLLSVGHFQVVGCIQGHDLPGADESNPIAKLVCFFHVVSSEEDSYSLAREVLDQPANVTPDDRV